MIIKKNWFAIIQTSPIVNYFLTNSIVSPKMADPEERTCPICLSPEEEVVDPQFTGCCHFFCKLCLTQALEADAYNKCPICRAKLDPVTFELVIATDNISPELQEMRTRIQTESDRLLAEVAQRQVERTYGIGLAAGRIRPIIPERSHTHPEPELLDDILNNLHIQSIEDAEAPDLNNEIDEALTQSLKQIEIDADRRLTMDLTHDIEMEEVIMDSLNQNEIDRINRLKEDERIAHEYWAREQRAHVNFMRQENAYQKFQQMKPKKKRGNRMKNFFKNLLTNED